MHNPGSNLLRWFSNQSAGIVLLAGIACGASQVSAADTDGAGLVQKHRCYPCHSQSENLLGPSYTSIAQRHAANREIMTEVLAEKIIDGGAGTWGVVPMVPNEQVSREDARVIAKWILDQGQK
jgi:cytochrome c